MLVEISGCEEGSHSDVWAFIYLFIFLGYQDVVCPGHLPNSSPF